MIRPAVEAFREATRLLVLEREEQLSWAIGLLDSHVLNVNLMEMDSVNFSVII
jgi:hypothetical protein